MSYIYLDNIPLKIKSISRDPQLNVVNKGYVDGGSFVKSKGAKGRKLELTVHVGKDQIEKIEELKQRTTPVILTSESKANYNGQYYILNIPDTESKKGIWNFTITLQEYIEANIVWANFENYNISSSGGGAAGGDTLEESPLSNCPTLQKGDRNECVGELQSLLKLLGYYVYSNGHSVEIDEYFSTYTEDAVKAFQRDNGLEATGIVGPETRAKLTL